MVNERNDENEELDGEAEESHRRRDALADEIEPSSDDEDGDDDDEEEDDDDEEEEEEDALAHLPDYVLSRVETLRELNQERDQIMECYLQERAALEKKYAALCKPLYEERAAIVQGEKEGQSSETLKAKNEENGSEERTEGDCAENGHKQGHTVNGEAGTDTDEGSESRVKGIPQFWVCSMTQMESVGELITEEDVDCLEHLLNITCNDREDGKGFTLEFHFSPNDYFHDSVLTKSYEVPNLLLSDEPILKNVSGCKIRWKPDRSLTYRTVKKKQRGKGRHAGQVRTITKKEQKESFFHWFDPPKLPTMEDMDEEEAEHLEEKFDNDYDVAQAFRCHIIPKAVLWFTGQAADQEMEIAMDNA